MLWPISLIVFPSHLLMEWKFVFLLIQILWVGVGVFSKVVVTFSHVGGSFTLFSTTTRDVWIIPSFRIWVYVLYVEHISFVIMNCGQHPSLLPNSCLGLAGGKSYKEITTPMFRLLQNFAIPGCFPYIRFHCYLFSLHSSGWVVIAICDSISVLGTS